MANPLRVRIATAVLGVAAFMPWYSQALVDRDTYLGNPLPLIDWVVLGAAVAVLVRPQLAMVAGIIGLADVMVGCFAHVGRFGRRPPGKDRAWSSICIRCLGGVTALSAEGPPAERGRRRPAGGPTESGSLTGYRRRCDAGAPTLEMK